MLVLEATKNNPCFWEHTSQAIRDTQIFHKWINKDPLR